MAEVEDIQSPVDIMELVDIVLQNNNESNIADAINNLMTNISTSDRIVGDYYNTSLHGQSTLSGDICTGVPGLTPMVLALRLIITPLILIVGMLGNAFGYLMILTLKKDDLQYFYLKWICLFNIMTGLSYWLLVARDLRTFLVSPYTTDVGWITFSARFNLMLINSFYTSGLYCLCFIMLDRYVALCHPLKYASFKRRPWLRRMPGPILAVNLLLCASSYAWFGVKSCLDPADMGRTFYVAKVEEPHWLGGYNIFTGVVQYIIPGVFIFFFGCNISFSLWQFFRSRDIGRRFLITPSATIVPAPANTINLGHSTIDFGAGGGVVPQSPTGMRPCKSSSNLKVVAETEVVNDPEKILFLKRSPLKIPFLGTKIRPTTNRSDSSRDVAGLFDGIAPPAKRLKGSLDASTNGGSACRKQLKNIGTLIHFLLYCILNTPLTLVMITRQRIENGRNISPHLVTVLIANANIFEVTFVAINVYIYFFFDENFRRFFRPKPSPI